MFRVILTATVFTALIFLLGWYFSDISLYFVFSLVLAAALRPLTNKINNLYVMGQHIPRALSIVLSFGAVLSVVFFLVLLFIPLFRSQVALLQDLDINYLYDQIQRPIDNLEGILIQLNLINNEPGYLIGLVKENLINSFNEVNIQGFINQVISTTSSFFISILAVGFITFFLLLENGLLRRNLLNFIPNKYFELSVATFHKVERLLSNYLLGLLIQMSVIFSIASIGLTLANVDYAMTIAVFAAVANLIPYAGPLLGTIFGVLVGLSTGDFNAANEVYFFLFKVLAVFSVVQLSDNVILQPFIFSKSVKAHPLEIFVIIFAGAKIAGVLGMIFAIPVYTIFRVSIQEFYKGYKEYRIFKIDKI
ncbi:Predicted PurR-regulated permease PerM [Cyclobacterium xiamenense]|uniref:Predicted PurR-regulated permease PerM n=1 Tax=Cyclobacterium xiamenense TaxID=1297121 RepID=A0A1H6Z5K2_9BACT|nr:AI-2E family transporter [Cyclobacterium xiamenense]SEJ48823.1 Predicted PurR-regulated permease PerM [Cyclobacterium xiamenense]